MFLDVVVEKLHFIDGGRLHEFIHTYPGRLVSVDFDDSVGQFELRQYDGWKSEHPTDDELLKRHYTGREELHKKIHK